MIKNINGLCTKEITLYAKDDVKPGMAVEIQESYTVGIPGVNSRFFGVCTGINGNYATVAISGIVTVPFSGANIDLGYNTLAGDGTGKVKLDMNGDDYMVVLDIDDENKLITILLDK